MFSTGNWVINTTSVCIVLVNTRLENLMYMSAFYLLFFFRDLPNAMTRMELESIIRLPDIIHHAKQTVSVLELSARDGVALQKVADWIQHNIKPSS